MSLENRKRTRSEASGRSTPSAQRRKTGEISRSPTTKPPRLSPLKEANRYFHASDYVIVKAAHDMVGKLVVLRGPYRRKLLDLATTSSMEHENPIEDPRRVHVRETTADEVVTSAWNKMTYYWAKQADTRVRKEKATAFASMGKEDKRHFHIIAINSCFRQNDYLTGQVNGDEILKTTMGKKTLLLFFRKIKREFLHIVHRYLHVEYPHNFGHKLTTPTKYTPYYKQQDSSTPLPEVGDHDEEEDSGGPILPRYNNKKLSEKNQICVQFNRTFLVLNDAQVSRLLNLDMYFDTVECEGTRHDNGFWSAKTPGPIATIC